jgi:preprotein translocase subunit SecD
VGLKGVVMAGLVVFLIPSCSSRQPTLDSQPTTAVEIRLAALEPRSGFMTMRFADTGDPVYVSPRVVVSNDDIRSAQFVLDGQGRPAVEILLNTLGTEKFARFTSEHIGEMAAILVEGKVSSAPVIRAQIANGRAIINGDFTQEEARELARSIVLHE